MKVWTLEAFDINTQVEGKDRVVISVVDYEHDRVTRLPMDPAGAVVLAKAILETVEPVTSDLVIASRLPPSSPH